MLGDGVWPRMLVFGPDEQEEAVSEQERPEPPASDVDALAARLYAQVSTVPYHEVWESARRQLIEDEL